MDDEGVCGYGISVPQDLDCWEPRESGIYLTGNVFDIDFASYDYESPPVGIVREVEIMNWMNVIFDGEEEIVQATVDTSITREREEPQTQFCCNIIYKYNNNGKFWYEEFTNFNVLYNFCRICGKFLNRSTDETPDPTDTKDPVLGPEGNTVEWPKYDPKDTKRKNDE
jgi:hypothetical protein